MATHQLSLEFTNSWIFRIARDHDVFLMDFFCRSGRWCDSDMRDLNAVQLHLQVATLSALLMEKGSTSRPSKQLPLLQEHLLYYGFVNPISLTTSAHYGNKHLPIFLTSTTDYSNPLAHGTRSQINSGLSTIMKRPTLLCHPSTPPTLLNSFAPTHMGMRPLLLTSFLTPTFFPWSHPHLIPPHSFRRT
jgi:hypothetical protein